MSNPKSIGSPTYAADLFGNHEKVVARLSRKNPSIDRADLHDAFVKAILDLAEKPEKYDAQRGTSIEDFLVGAAQRALLPIIRSNGRRKRREEKYGRAVAGEHPAARLILEQLADSEQVQQAQSVAKNDLERSALQLWALGHSDAEIAANLRIDVTEATRIRDRLTQRLRRLRHQADNEAAL